MEGGGRRKAPLPLPLSTPASQSGLHMQWKLDMTRAQRLAKFVRNNGFFLSKFSFVHFHTITGAKKIVPDTEDLVI